jgi:hypothetical protein
MKKLLSILSLASISITAILSPANADTYRAGEFTIDISNHHYHGCDAKGNCIDLDNGTKWRDGGKRGETWENGEYAYIISWPEGHSELAQLIVVGRDNRQILRRKLVPINGAR